MKEKVFLSFCILHNLRFFNFEPYLKMGRLLDVVDILMCLFYLAYFLFKQTNVDKTSVWKVMRLFYVVYLFSVLVALVVNGQSFINSFWGMARTYLNWGFFFYLASKNYDFDEIIKIIKSLTFAYIVVHTLCLIMAPNNIFGVYFYKDTDDVMDLMNRNQESRGIARFMLLGGDFVTLGLFYLANLKKRVSKQCLYIFIFLVFTILRATRFPIASTFIVTCFVYFFSNGITLKKNITLGTISILLFFALSQINITNKVINSLVGTTKNEISEKGKENVRLLSFEYFTMEFNEGRMLPVIIGNGPMITGSYKEKIDNAMSLGLFDSDIEYLRWYLYFGIIGLVVLIRWAATLLRTKIPPEYNYLKAFIIYLFMVMSLGSHFDAQIPLITFICYGIYSMNKEHSAKIIIQNECR